MPQSLATIPNVITACRLALVPVLLILAMGDHHAGFLLTLAVCFVSDAADGFLARRLGHTSQWGAHLDSWADFSVYLAIPISAWWLWPDVLWRESLYFAAVVSSIILSPAIAFLKFHAAPSYHTWAAKLAAFTIAVSLMLLFGLDIAWPFHIATLVTVLAAIEEISITLALPQLQSDVRSLWHVWHRRTASPARSRPR